VSSSGRWRARPEGHRSEADDREVTLYSLRRFVALACAGNPNLIALQYAPEEAVHERTVLGDELRALAPMIVSQHAVRRTRRGGPLDAADAGAGPCTGHGGQNR
jgi:hypothetical protein